MSLEKLVFPTRLQDNQRALAARYLATIPEHCRQAVLDELAGRLQAEQRGARPVYDELRYLHRLCMQVNRGGFSPNLGLKMQDERERRQEAAERARAQAAERERKASTSRPIGENAIAEIRKLLGAPQTPGSESR